MKRFGKIIVIPLVLAAIPALSPLNAQMVISEFLAVNDKGLQDSDNDHSDWIELHNAGEQPVNLEGWFLTDTAKDFQQWRFPATRMEAGDFLVVFASGKDRTQAGEELHTNFKLQGNGEYLALIQPDGVTVAHHYSPKYPNQNDDVAYGIDPDWSTGKFTGHSLFGYQEYFKASTPGAPNESALLGRVGKLAFSHGRGFFEAPFELVIKTPTNGAVIRYTTDGSVPATEHGEVLEGPLTIGQTTVLRAAAFKPGHKPAKSITQTYLFRKDVVRQSPDGLPPPGFHYQWGGNRMDYGMDTRVVEDSRYREKVFDALKAIPSYSLVMGPDDLFGEENGIYSNAEEDGREWERPCSLELIRPDGEEGFQTNCGVRIRGGFSRRASNAKHAFRFFFRREYGPGKLKYPVFGRDAAQVFDNLDLRTFQNYSWSMSGDPRGIFMRDQLSRDLQLATGQAGARGDFCHLYINGQYWGLYNTCERPEASYGATYFKGKEEDFDVIKIGRGRGNGSGDTRYGCFATDGTLDAWRRLWEAAKAGLADNAAYQKVLGNLPDGTRNPDYETLLDPSNLIDYMLVIFYGGNLDAPITSFAGNRSANNWYGIRNRNGDEGFRFFVWDAEHTLLDLGEDRTGPFPAGDEFSRSNPQWIWQQCLENPEFRMLVADRVHRHFVNGVLTPESVRSRFLKRVTEIETAVIGESARWGDVRSRYGSRSSSGPMTVDDHWRPEVNHILENYIPDRSLIVVDQLWSHGLIPDLEPVHFAKRGGVVEAGFELAMSSGQGKVYYTLDGSDPRLIGDQVAPVAAKYDGPVRITQTAVVKARVLFEGEWSAIDEAPFLVKENGAAN